MERGLYIAATGMLSDITRQDTIASNLANVNTAGFKADHVVNESFSDLFLKSVKGADVGPLNMGTQVAGVVTDFAQGPLRATENPLDVAIGGDGFLTVQVNGKTMYTRDGELTRNAQGQLVTQRNELVLGVGGQPITIGEGDPSITTDGRVYDSNKKLVGQLDIATLDVGATAHKVGDNMWDGVRTGSKPADTSIRQGFIEQSSVNSVLSMVDMINTLRSYESAQRAVTAIDGTLDKAVNSVGAVS